MRATLLLGLVVRRFVRFWIPLLPNGGRRIVVNGLLLIIIRMFVIV